MMISTKLPIKIYIINYSYLLEVESKEDVKDKVECHHAKHMESGELLGVIRRIVEVIPLEPDTLFFIPG